jgi:hypothetical protein
MMIGVFLCLVIVAKVDCYRRINSGVALKPIPKYLVSFAKSDE